MHDQHFGYQCCKTYENKYIKYMCKLYPPTITSLKSQNKYKKDKKDVKASPTNGDIFSVHYTGCFKRIKINAVFYGSFISNAIACIHTFS